MKEVEMVDINVDGVRWTVPEPVATRIAELESICENNADALAFYDARGKRIAALEGLLRRADAHIQWLDRHDGEPSDHDLNADIAKALRGEGE